MIEVTTADGIRHVLPALTDTAIQQYSSSKNTRSAIHRAISDGNTKDLVVAEKSPNSDYALFRLRLISSSEFIAWAETIGFVKYTNLTQAAMADNWILTQQLYNAAAAESQPNEEQKTTWGAIATECSVDFIF
ncbi:hypothetical protein D0962_37230 [Leptolyngbyaceae cyanobacterium CCMR0082]|uniref:Uncharacterized protein n=1 Tax=Adonisia turfae CCMR0082 TaxID=2304604 RepID=A0A6M0SM61_9CYAN|nr:hypothetical protein [Adonisia turfae]NEZ68312.1 hypothetical protein [Adonisia turfae CCMR0082]